MLQVAGAERHPEMALHEPLDDRGHLLLRGAHLAGRALQRAIARDAVGGDRDVHDDVGDAELVDEVAERAELGDELRLERPEGAGADGSLAERAAQRVEVEGPGIHLVVRELAEQAPLRHLGAAQPRPGGRPLERELGAAQQARAHEPGRHPASRG